MDRGQTKKDNKEQKLRTKKLKEVFIFIVKKQNRNEELIMSIMSYAAEEHPRFFVGTWRKQQRTFSSFKIRKEGKNCLKYGVVLSIDNIFQWYDCCLPHENLNERFSTKKEIFWSFFSSFPLPLIRNFLLFQLTYP